MERKFDLRELVGDEILAKFCKIAEENGANPETVLSDFVKNYVVSSGQPGKFYK